MIYLLEGISGSGKTTFSKTFDSYEYKKLMLKTVEEIKNELENNKDKDVVYDRLFMNCWLDKSDEELSELNKYLKSLSYVKCIRFMTSTKEESFERKVKFFKENGTSYNEKYLKEFLFKEYDRYLRVFGIMDVFKEKEN